MRLSYSLVFFMLAIVVVNQVKDRWKLPLWQNMLTFLNGMLGNFIFLLEPFYVAVYKGPAAQGTVFVLPYLLGVISSLVLAGSVRRYFKNDLFVQLVGLAAGLSIVEYSLHVSNRDFCL